MGRLILALVVALAGVLVGTATTTPATAAYAESPGRSWVPNDTVYDIARAGGTIYIAGDFTNLSDPVTGATVTRHRVAALDAATGEPLPWNPGANGTVRAVDAAGGKVYIGGAFNEVAGRPANRIAAVGADGDLVPGWRASASNVVWRIHATARAVYIGGLFNGVSGVQRARLARLDPDTGDVVRSFNAHVGGGRVRGIAPSPDGRTLYIGGVFTSLGGQPRGFVGEVDADTGQRTNWAPEPWCETCHIFDLAAEGGRVFAAVGGGGGRVLAYNTQSSSVAWRRGGDGDVQAIDVEDGIVYAGGHFGPVFNDQPRRQLVALEASNGRLLDFRPPFMGRDFPGVWAVLADTSGLHLGGDSRFSGTDVRRYARFRYVVAPPSEPRNVTTTVRRNAVEVSWAAPATGGPVDRYQVSVDPRGGFPDDRVCVTARRSCSVPIGRGGLVEGDSYRFTVRGVNDGGAGPTAASGSVVADGRGPSVTLLGRAWRVVTGGESGLGWRASDPSGVDGFQVAKRTGHVRKGFSAWTTTSTGAASTTVSVAPGTTVCTKVRGIDNRGNVGRWSKQKCRSAPLDDRSLAARGSVRRVSGDGYFQDTVSRVSGPRSFLRIRNVKVTSASLVGWTCARCGKVRVYYGKRLVKTVNLRSTTGGQKVVALPAPGKAGRRGLAVTLRPVDARPVLIDGLAFRAR